MKPRFCHWFPGCCSSRRLVALAALAMANVVLTLALTGCGTEPAVASIPKQSANTKRAIQQAALDAQADGSDTNSSGPRSHFYAGLDARNPFFPNSRRRPATAESGQDTRTPIERYLKLVGIRPGTTRPMALINRTAFAPGEEADVTVVISNELNRAETKKVSIRCLEIRRDSVLISITGEQGVKELKMAHGR